MKIGVVLALCAPLLFAPSYFQDETLLVSVPARAVNVPPSRQAIKYSFSPIVKKAAPAVVNVYVHSKVKTFTSPFVTDPIFSQLFGELFGDSFRHGRERLQRSLGSGVIVSPGGFVVTSTHVLKVRGQASISVALSDKREFPAEIVSVDEKTDVAILKIQSSEKSFPYVELEDSDKLEVGDLVLAIGNPFGIGQTVTSGIVSAVARSQVASDAVFIQTDAAINPGNSGGALMDVNGKLVGINTAIFSQTGRFHGIGFAIPSNLVKLFVDSAASGQAVQKPWLGARLEPITRELAKTLELNRISGALVYLIYDKSPADEAGLEPGDVIVRVDGFDVSDPRAVNYRLTTQGVGKQVELIVIRDGQRLVRQLRLVSAPKLTEDDVRKLSGNHPLDGAKAANILPVVAEELLLDHHDGVAVLSVKNGSIAAYYGFQKGDVITEYDQKKISSIDDLVGALSSHTRKNYWTVTIKRGGRQFAWRLPKYRRR